MKLNKFEMALLIVPIAAAIIALFFLPDTIPLHWNDGVADRYGSKFFILIIGILPYFIYKSFRRRFWP